MINVRFIISTLLLLIIGISQPIMAGEYKVLVIPNSSVDITKKSSIGTTDIEEMLSKKIISKLESSGMACAPTIDILKISILNNPYYVPKSSNPMNNVKIISNSYNVSRVILVTSRMQIQNQNKQKEFWSKLDLPVISQANTDAQLVTTITMYDMKSNQVLWNDVYYQRIDQIGGGINNYSNNSTKISAINSYYDKISDSAIRDLRTTKETSAILVKKPPKSTTSTKTTTALIKPVDSKNLTSYTTSKTSYQKTTQTKSANLKTASNTGIFSNLKKGIADKKKDYERRKTEKEIAKLTGSPVQKQKNTGVFLPSTKPQAAKNSEQTKTVAAKPQTKTTTVATKQITQTKNQIKTDKPVITTKAKTANNNIKTVQKPQVKAGSNNKNSVAQNTSKTIEKAKNKLKEITAQKEKPVKTVNQKPKPAKSAVAKTTRPSITDRIKNKYQSIVEAYNTKRETNIRQEQNALHYSTVSAPVFDGVPQVNSYIQTKPRNNARGYTPKFDSSVNDI